MSEWKEYKLEELTISKGCYGIAAPAIPYTPNKHKYLRITDINDDGTLNRDSMMSVDDKNADNYILKKNDIVFARTGNSTGRTYFYDGSDGKLVYAGFLIKFSINPDLVNPKYIKYYCQSSIYKNWIHSFNTGSTRGNINAQTYGNMKIIVPPRKQQDLLVKVLSAIDDKIELNNKINANLEEQLISVFNQFKENAPTKKYKLKDTVLTANTGADAIQKAPIVDYDTGVRCIRVGDMSNNRRYWEWGYTKVTPQVLNQYQLKENDILITRTAILGLNTLIDEDLAAVYNNGLIRIKIDAEKIHPLFLYRQFQTKDFYNYVNRIESETSVRPNMKIDYLLSYEFSCPSIEKQMELINIIQSMASIQNKNRKENNYLAQLRDTLLPKLMNGEIDVENIPISAIIPNE